MNIFSKFETCKDDFLLDHDSYCSYFGVNQIFVKGNSENEVSKYS